MTSFFRQLTTPSQTRLLVAGVAMVAVVILGGAQATNKPRAKPPTFSAKQRATFFDDAFAMLDGERPNFTTLAAQVASSATGGGNSATAKEKYAWSKWISTDTLETEIKRQTQQVSKLVQSSTSFKGGGYRDCRDAFSTLAVMFSISADHDDDARWSDRAAGLAALIGRAGGNCKVGTDNSYREASARGEDLAELVRGGRPDVPEPTGDDGWDTLADRAPLMRRLEVALQDRLGPLVASEPEFKRGAEDALHQAQVIAALAEVLTQEGFDDAGDEDYDAFARTLRDAAADISSAAEQENYSPIRDAYGRASKACSECHDLYRG